MRIKSISVKNLFGVFNHDIPMHLDEHITIIHGPNGFGKTVLLRMLDGLFNSRYGEFRSIPFAEFRLQFDDESEVWVSKVGEAPKGQVRKRNNTVKPVFNCSRPGENIFVFPLPESRLDVKFPLSMVEQVIPDLERIGREQWRDTATGDVFSLDEILDRYSNELPIQTLPGTNNEPLWLQELSNSFHVRLIQTQRLTQRLTTHSDKQKSIVLAVNRYSAELSAEIRSTLAKYATLSQSLDRSFPQRLMQGPSSLLTLDQLSQKLRELEQKRLDLMKIGLLDEEKVFQGLETIDETKRSVLSIYVQDVEEKLKVFDDVAARIKLFSKIINGRFSYKSITISKENGFTFKTSNGTPLDPSSLSSGEQHELVLLYELLFKIKSNSLVLIDEPELSLHIAWQEQFLRDLQQITQLSNFDVLISTHSPQIINDRWDLTVELKRPAQ